MGRETAGRKYRGARAFDVVGALTLLVATAPLLIAASVAVALSLGRPILFKHVRPGIEGIPFTLLKFRTMREPERESDRYYSDGQRVTSVGRLLRQTSVDELPSLVNVLRGEMSLVGPRPLLFEHVPHLNTTAHRRMLIPPGITGLAQVRGRQELTFSRRFELDIEYVESCSFLMDLRILALTLLQLISIGKGVETGQNLEDIDDMGIFNRRS